MSDEFPGYLLFDTETSGLPNFRAPADDPSQPRLASICMIRTSMNAADTLEMREHLIKPDGWKMDPQAAAVNGLTDELLEAEGVPVKEALDYYEEQIRAGYVVVAYHAQFDCKVMRGEFRRAGRDDLFDRTRNICAMRSTNGLDVKKASGKGGFPKLSDTYRRLFGEEIPGAHGSYADTIALQRVFVELLKRGLALPPAIHYAKDCD